MWWVALLFLHKYAQLGEVRAHICEQPLPSFVNVVCLWSPYPSSFHHHIEKKAYISLCSTNIATRRNALCMTFCWFAFSMGYFGLIYNTPAFNWNIYLVFVFPTFVTIPTALSQPLFENKVGRKPIFTFSLLTAGKRWISDLN